MNVCLYISQLVMLDANKGAYIKYYDLIMENDLLSDNGVLVADNGNSTMSCTYRQSYLYFF
jgi:predicted O-methyltransferase YrrM